MILVTGGTGLVGAHLLYYLSQKEVHIRAIHRKESDLKRVEKVFGYYSENASSLFKKIEWVGADVNDIATEENEWNHQNVNVYALSKFEAEMEVWRGSQEGLPVVMINPGVIIGPGFWNTGSGALFTTANKGYRFYPPGGTGFITVHDVVKMMTSLMNSEIKNERFIAVTENLPFQEILIRLTKVLGKPAPKKKLRYWQLEIGRIGDSIWSAITGNSRRITKNSIHSMKHRDMYTNQKIQAFIDFQFEPLDPTITFSCHRFLEENL